MPEGWIKLHRSLLNWEWYDDINTKVLFFHLLLSCNYEQKKWRGVNIEPGQIITGRYKLSEQTGLSEQQVRTSLSKLKSTNEITIKTTSKFSVITVVSWKSYQQPNQQPNQQSTNNQPTSNQQVTTTKEGKNIKNDKNSNTIADFSSACIKKVFLEFRSDDYYWTPKDGTASKQLLKKIIFKFKRKNNRPPDEQEAADLFRYVMANLNKVNNGWYDNKGIAVINSGFNDIVEELKNTKHGKTTNAAGATTAGSQKEYAEQFIEKFKGTEGGGGNG